MTMKELAKEYATYLITRSRTADDVAISIVNLKVNHRQITEKEIWQLVSLIREQIPSIIQEQVIHYAHGADLDVGDDLENSIKSILAGR